MISSISPSFFASYFLAQTLLLFLPLNKVVDINSFRWGAFYVFILQLFFYSTAQNDPIRAEVDLWDKYMTKFDSHSLKLAVSPQQDRCLAALVRVEKTEFLSPVFIGEVAHVTAEITYTSKHSLEVQVKVMAENILTGDSFWFKVKVQASLWPFDYAF